MKMKLLKQPKQKTKNKIYNKSKKHLPYYKLWYFKKIGDGKNL